MNPGELRQRVTIQRRTVVRDSYGGETITWADVAEVWAKISAIGGREYFAAGQTLAESTFILIMRYRTDVKQSWRLQNSKGTLYDIQTVIPNANYSMMTLGCIEVVL